MRKTRLAFLFLLFTSLFSKAQGKFELAVTGKTGYYFPDLEKSTR